MEINILSKPFPTEMSRGARESRKKWTTTASTQIMSVSSSVSRNRSSMSHVHATTQE